MLGGWLELGRFFFWLNVAIVETQPIMNKVDIPKIPRIAEGIKWILMDNFVLGKRRFAS